MSVKTSISQYNKKTNNTNQSRRKIKRYRLYIECLYIFLFVLMLLFAVIFLGVLFKNRFPQKSQHTGNNIKISIQDSPVINNEKSEIYDTLKELADSNSDYSIIYERREEYPINLLNALIHNEEMLEFVKGYFKADKNSIGTFTAEELKKENPLFIQWDKRWGYANYGDSMMAVVGCGPTSLSMAILALTGNADATPYNVAKLSYENGYYDSNVGSLWKLISEGSMHYGLSAKTLPLHKDSLTQSLDSGSILILSMGPGNFTSSGHFIVIYDYDEKGFYVNDPNSYERSKKVWPFTEFSSEIKNIWALSKK